MKKPLDINVQSKKNLLEKDSSANLDNRNSFFSKPLRVFILIIIFAAAFLVRLYHIDEPPLFFHPNRQYHAAEIARQMYYSHTKSVTEQQRAIADLNRAQEVKGELPILEFAAAIGYKIAGGEHLWIPKVFSVIFWLVGGAFLYRFVSTVLSADAAIVSLLFFLFLPYGIEASRSFQPNPMMIMLLIISINVIYNYFERPVLKNLFIAAGVSSLTLFTYPTSVFPVLIMFIALAFYTKGFFGALFNWRYWLWGIITVLPTAIYYIYTIFVSGNIVGYAQVAFLPSMLLRSSFWRSWLTQIDKVYTIAGLIAALAGLAILPKGKVKALLLGLWLSYIIYSCIFTYHTSTHDYYQLPLFPAMAISLGALAAPSFKWLNETCTNLFRRITPVMVLLFAGFLGIVLAIPQLYHPGVDDYLAMLKNIGNDVNHSMKTIFLTDFYGKPLLYHGEISGFNWPNSGDFRAYQMSGQPIETAEERFKQFSEIQKGSEFFIVTDFREFNMQTDLKQFLTKNYPLLTQTGSYVIFDLRKKLTGK
jgi:hypothetical protein